jgi:hypothetical protein
MQYTSATDIRNYIQDMDKPLVREYVYHDMNVCHNNNAIAHHGLDPSLTYDEVLILAHACNCHGIVRTGKGRWYLRNKSFDDLKYHIEDTRYRHFSIGTMVVLLDY